LNRLADHHIGVRRRERLVFLGCHFRHPTVHLDAVDWQIDGNALEIRIVQRSRLKHRNSSVIRRVPYSRNLRISPFACFQILAFYFPALITMGVDNE